MATAPTNLAEQIAALAQGIGDELKDLKDNIYGDIDCGLLNNYIPLTFTSEGYTATGGDYSYNYISEFKIRVTNNNPFAVTYEIGQYGPANNSYDNQTGSVGRSTLTIQPNSNVLVSFGGGSFKTLYESSNEYDSSVSNGDTITFNVYLDCFEDLNRDGQIDTPYTNRVPYTITTTYDDGTIIIDDNPLV